MAILLTLPNGEKVKVNDAFMSLPADQQGVTLAQIAEARGAKLSDTPAAPQNGTDDSLGSTLMAGVTGAGKGLEATARVVGRQMDMPDGGMVGRFIARNTPDAPKNYADPYQGTKDAWNKGDYLGTAKGVGRAALQSLPDMAATLAAAGVGGGAPGAAAYTAARSLGENVETAQANNGTAGQPATAGEMLRGGAVTGVQAALGGATVAKPIGAIANPLTRGAAKVGAEAVSNFGQDVVGQVGLSAGTEQGAQFDPAQAAIAAAQGGLVRGMTSAAGTAGKGVKAGLGAVGDRIAEIGVPKVEDTDQAASVSRVARQIEEARASSARPMTNTEAANSVREKIKQDLYTATRQMRDSGIITPEDYRSIMDPLIKQAGHHNQSIGDAAWDALAAAKGLNLPDDITKPLVSTLTDLNVLSNSGRMNRGSGPFERILRPVGMVASTLGGAAAGGPMGLLASGAGALAGHSVGGSIGGGIGRFLDRGMGMQEPDVIRQARSANAMLAKAGMDAGPLPAETAQALVKTTGKGMREQMGLSEDAPTGSMDPTTGKPFGNLVDAVAHSKATGENVVYMNPDREIVPSVLTADQVEQLLASTENPKARTTGYHMNRLVADLKAQKAAQEKTQAADTAASVQAMRDQETMDAAAGKRDAQKTKQTDTAYAEKTAQERAAEMAARVRAAAFGAAEQAASRARSADEKAAGRVQDAQARDEAAQSRQAAAATRGEVATRSADMAAMAKVQAALETVKRKDAAATDRALTRNERAADWVSGVDFRQRRAAETDAAAFARTGGREGNPAGPSDPLMVRADGTPVEASRKPARASEGGAATTPAPSPVEAAQVASQASGGILPATPWVSYLRRHMESVGVDPHGITYTDFIKAAHELADAGHIPRDFATSLETYHGPAVFDQANPTKDPLRLIAARAAENKGQGGAVVTGFHPNPMVARAAAASQAGTRRPDGARAPIYDPQRWAAVRGERKAYAADLAATAEKRGFPELSDAIKAVAVEKEAAEKTKVAKAFLASLPMKTAQDKARHGMAVTALNDRTLRKGI